MYNHDNSIIMKTKIENIEDYNIFTDENGNLTAELKTKSLKLEHIINTQTGINGFYLDFDGINTGYLSPLSEGIKTDQIKRSTARKAMLYGQILRIADYANGDWEKTKGNKFYHIVKDINDKIVSIEQTSTCSFEIYFKSKELARKAYDDNKALFDEFFSL